MSSTACGDEALLTPRIRLRRARCDGERQTLGLDRAIGQEDRRQVS